MKTLFFVIFCLLVFWYPRFINIHDESKAMDKSISSFQESSESLKLKYQSFNMHWYVKSLQFMSSSQDLSFPEDDFEGLVDIVSVFKQQLYQLSLCEEGIWKTLHRIYKLFTLEAVHEDFVTQVAKNKKLAALILKNVCKYNSWIGQFPAFGADWTVKVNESSIFQERSNACSQRFTFDNVMYLCDIEKCGSVEKCESVENITSGCVIKIRVNHKKTNDNRPEEKQNMNVVISHIFIVVLIVFYILGEKIMEGLTYIFERFSSDKTDKEKQKEDITHPPEGDVAKQIWETDSTETTTSEIDRSTPHTKEEKLHEKRKPDTNSSLEPLSSDKTDKVKQKEDITHPPARENSDAGICEDIFGEDMRRTPAAGNDDSSGNANLLHAVGIAAVIALELFGIRGWCFP